MAKQKYPDFAYLQTNWMEGDRDVDIRQSETRMVTTRKPHTCLLNRDKHEIPAGSRALYNHAIVDDAWCQWYGCIECMDAWLEEVHYSKTRAV